jgi:predicted RNA-binding protein with TRAM domain
MLSLARPNETRLFPDFLQSSLITRNKGRPFSGTDLLGCEKTSFGRGGYGRSSGGSGGFRSFKPKPVEVGKEYDVTISEISRRGDGIAKIDGFVIFVAGAKQGWQGKIKVTQVANRFATGAVVGGSEGMSGTEGQASTSESEGQGM